MTETGDVNLEVVGSPSSLNAKEVLLGELTGDGLGGAIFNMVNSILGAGIIGIPYALRECGLLVGIFFLVLVAAVTHWTTCLLIEVRNKYGAKSFLALAEKFGGVMAGRICAFFLVLFPVGACLIYMIVIGDVMPPIFAYMGWGALASRPASVALFGCLIILPLSCLKNMDSLAFSSLLSIISDLLIVFIVWGAAGPQVAAFQALPQNATFTGMRGGVMKTFNVSLPQQPVLFANTGLFAGLGVICFAFVCQHSTLAVYDSLKEKTPERWNIVSLVSLAVSVMACLILGVAGYGAFRDTTEADILNNFPVDNVPINFARFFLALTMIFTYPMEHFIVRRNALVVYKIYRGEIQDPTEKIQVTDLEHYGFTLLFWAITMIFGLTVTDLGIVLQLAGVLTAAFVGFVFTGLAGILVELENARTSGEEPNKWRLWFSGTILTFGVIAMVAGMVQIIMQHVASAS